MATIKEEVKRLRRELKATPKPTREMHEKYNAALQKLKALKDEYEWNKSIGREFACAEAETKEE